MISKLERLRALKDPSYGRELAMREVFTRIHTSKGEPGYAPVKGVDYFTPNEISSMIEYMLGIIRGEVRDGYTPVKGVDFFDGETPQKGIHYNDGAPGKAGKGGKTPIKGVDYFTQAERDHLIAEAAKRAKGQDGKSPRIEDIVTAVVPAVRATLTYEDIKNAPDLTDLPELIEFLKRGGFRGGGSSAAVSATPVSVDLSSQCDGVNKTFVVGPFTTILSLIGSDAPIVYRPVIDFTAASPNITLDPSPDFNAPSAGATLIVTYV